MAVYLPTPLPATVHTVRDDRRRDAQELRTDVPASTITSPARGIALGVPGNGQPDRRP